MKYFAAIVKVPGRILGPFVMLLLIVGAYSYDNNIAHSAMVLILGSAAYWLDKFKFSTIPVILGFVMGPIIEVNLNRALLMGTVVSLGWSGKFQSQTYYDYQSEYCVTA